LSSDSLPSRITPQLATLVDAPPKGDGWTYEIKLDGYRILARNDAGDVRLFTRNGHDWTAKMPHIANALEGLLVKSVWLDGEVVVIRSVERAASGQ
jgi:bifunctional non-homologous end joining protein LigD